MRPRITPALIEAAKNTLSAKSTRALSALEMHVAAFGTLHDDGTLTYSEASIAQPLSQHGEQHYDLVGFAVHAFNAVHEGQNPLTESNFNHLPASLHLGTLRFYGADGAFSEANWDAFAAHNENKEFVAQSTLMSYVTAQTAVLPEEEDTGRHADGIFAEQEKAAQIEAGSAAWQEVFKILACDWQPTQADPSVNEPIVEMALLKLFYQNTPLALATATKLGLPVANPTAISTEAPLEERLKGCPFAALAKRYGAFKEEQKAGKPKEESTTTATISRGWCSLM